MDPTPMESFLSSLASIVTQVVSWVSSVAGTIVSTPILLLGVGFFVLGGAIGIFGRMLSRS